MPSEKTELNENKNNLNTGRSKGFFAKLIAGFITVGGVIGASGEIKEGLNQIFATDKEHIETDLSQPQEKNDNYLPPSQEDRSDEVKTVVEPKRGVPQTKVTETKPDVKETKLSLLIADFPQKSNDIKEIVFLVDNNQADDISLISAIQSSLELSLSNEGYEPVNPLTSEVSQKMIKQWVVTKNSGLADLNKISDYEAYASFNRKFSKDSNARDVCIITLSLTIKDLETKRTILRSNEDFRGNGYDKEAAFQTSLGQIERYIFIK